MKTLLMAIMLIVTVQLLPAQTYYYKQVKVVNNGHVGKGNLSGQFITFVNGKCYDSDNEGITVYNGSLKYIKTENNIHVYYGTSYWGHAYYFVKSDYTRINIKLLESDIIYVYARDPNLNNAKTCYYIKSRNNTIPNYRITTPYNIDSNSDNPPLSGEMECGVCKGTGNCISCNGKGWYNNRYDGNTYECRNCHGDGKCIICHGTGRVRY